MPSAEKSERPDGGPYTKKETIDAETSTSAPGKPTKEKSGPTWPSNKGLEGVDGRGGGNSPPRKG